jgi:hypothetical protein
MHSFPEITKTTEHITEMVNETVKSEIITFSSTNSNKELSKHVNKFRLIRDYFYTMILIISR